MTPDGTPGGPPILEQLCSVPDCLATPLGDDARCFAHTEDEVALERAIGELESGRFAEFMKGVRIDRTSMRRISRLANDRPLSADFSLAVFEEETNFAFVKFGRVNFRGARFEREAYFYDCAFFDNADFTGATFMGEASFAKSTFGGLTLFIGAAFEAAADFNSVTFGTEAELPITSFYQARFEGPAQFDHVSMIGMISFDEATLSDRVRLTQVTAAGLDLSLQAVTFPRYVDVEVEAEYLDCNRARFLAGGHIRASGTSIILKDAQFPTPMTISSITETPENETPENETPENETPENETPENETPENETPENETPRVVAPAIVRSLQGADVGHLLLSGVDMRDCRFHGAHNLDRLRMEAPMFAVVGWRLGFARRRLIAEEVHWRRDHHRSKGWNRVEGVSKAGVKLLEPSVIASIYRSLRKGREDSKDEPGAADFYYGEMEMRRHDSTRSAGERLVVVAYWLLSGYGLRASRALAALALVLLLATAAFDGCGFAFPQNPYGSNLGDTATTTSWGACWPNDLGEFAESLGTFDTWVFATSSAIAVIPRPEVALTTQGQTIRLVLRILGPLLIGLAFLSLRGRVKR